MQLIISKITYHIFKLNNSNANSDSNDHWSTAKIIFFSFRVRKQITHEKKYIHITNYVAA